MNVKVIVDGKKVWSKRSLIGKIDPKTGEANKVKYIERMKMAGTPIIEDEDVRDCLVSRF